MKLPAPVFRLLSRLPRPKGRKINRRKLSSFILTVGDEGAVLLQVVRGEIVSRFFSPAHNAKETGAFVDAVMEAPRLPLIILFDTLDQAYVQQTLPPVAAMSVSRLMRKRLQREFPSDYLKGALLLGREKEKRRDWIFLMAALQNTASVQAWLDMAAEWPNRCKGIYLTPLEAVAVARALDIARPVQDDRWHLLVSYNKVSGVRQIVYKNGQLVLTRLGHPAYESNAEAVAGAIEQEIIGTREYIKRLMAQAGSELTVTIIVSDDIRRHIDRGKLGVGQLQLLTPFEAAEALNFPTAAQSADRFGDIVLAVGIASAPKHLLKFVAPLMQRQNQYHTAIRMVRAATVCAALGLLALAGTSAWSIVVSGKAISALEERQQSVTAELQKSREKAASAKEDLEKIADVVNLYEHIGAQAFGPEPLLVRLSKLLAQKAHIVMLAWDITEKTAAPAAPAAAPGGAPPAPAAPPASASAAGNNPNPVIEMRLSLELPVPAGSDNKKIQEIGTDLLNIIKAGLPEYDITHEPLPGTVAENQQIDVTLTQGTPGAPQAQAGAALPVIQVTIKGPVEGKTEAKPPPAAGGAK